MTKVKGIYKGNTVQLLEPVAAMNGVEVEVIFYEPGEKGQTFSPTFAIRSGQVLKVLINQ